MQREQTPVHRRVSEETTKTAAWYATELDARRTETLAALDDLLTAVEDDREPTTREWRAALAASRTLARRLDEIEPDWHERRLAHDDPPASYV